jgi:hypothetical protein
MIVAHGAVRAARLCLVGLACLLATSPALAQAQAQTGGQISLQFDGATRSFEPRMDGARTGFTRFLSVDAVSIEGTDGAARLVLELSLMSGTGGSDQPHDARILYLPEGWRDYWVSPQVFPAGGVVIEALDLSGPEPHVAGRFDVPLCPTPGPTALSDPGRCKQATGRFATPLVADR